MEQYDDVTNRTYVLTETPGKEIWRSPQICAFGELICVMLLQSCYVSVFNLNIIIFVSLTID